MPKKQSPSVSVCIPVFNGENYIRDCIQSVLDQEYLNYELLVVDNCSTDDTAKIVKEIDDKRINYIKNVKNIGSVENFNKCIKEAQGEYFVLLPHDDLLLPNCLKQYVSKFKDKDVGFSYSSIRFVDENGGTKYSKINHPKNKTFSSEETIADIVEYFVPIQLAMVRTEILQRLGGFDIKYGLFCDVHLWLSIAFDGWKSSYVSEPLSCHRSHSEQGQNAFLNPNLATLGKHWGKKLDKSFWVKNSYNYLFLKVSLFLFFKMKELSYDTSFAKKTFLNRFARSHLRSILLAIFRLDLYIFIQEILLFKPAIRLFGFHRVIMGYPFVIINKFFKN